MFIMCQNCHRLYDVPVNKTTIGEQVYRCASCGFVFKGCVEGTQIQGENFLKPIPIIESKTEHDEVLSEIVRAEIHDNIDSEVVDIPVKEPMKIFEPVEVIVAEPSHRSSVGFAIVLMAFVVSLLLGFVAARFKIAETFPQTASIYHTLGLDALPAGHGLTVHGVELVAGYDGDVPVLRVQGVLENQTNKILEVPFIVIEMLDGKGILVGTHMFVLGYESLDARASITFQTQIKQVPMSAQKIQLIFKKA